MAKLGQKLQLTEADLDELAEITEEDIERTNELWIQFADTWAKNLLLAEAR